MFAKNIASVRSQACGLTEEVIESSSSNLGDDSITTEDSIIKDSISTEDSITNKDSIIKDSGTLLEEGIISMGLSQKVKGVFNHKGWFQWTFNFMLRKII